MSKYKDRIKKIFDEQNGISCPAFENEVIILNSKGINHLIYKGKRSRRSKERIEANIRLLPRSVNLLRRATFWQEESLYRKGEIVYRFWAFEAVVDGRRIKVIVRPGWKWKKAFLECDPWMEERSFWDSECYE